MAYGTDKTKIGVQLPPSIELLLRKSQRGVGQINARSGAKQAALAPYAGRAQANYAPAISNTQELGGALSGSLARQGGELAGGLAAALLGIQAPGQAIETHAGGVAQTGAGAAGAVGGLSSADLGRLRGFSSAEQVYAAALPRLAKLAGEQERRGLLAQAQQELSDLALREADRAAENARYEREWAYKVGQDARDRKRQAVLDRRALDDTLYDRKQDAREWERLGTLDSWAEQAKNAALGLDVSKYQAGQTELRPASEATNRSSGFIMGYNSAGRLVPFRGPNGQPIPYKPNPTKPKPTASGGGRADAFYDTREGAFTRAREYRGAGTTRGRMVEDPIPRAQARKRLMAEFGTALIGRGYKPKAVRQMIERALSAAGY